jgi:hypothetical protein
LKQISKVEMTDEMSTAALVSGCAVRWSPSVRPVRTTDTE